MFLKQSLLNINYIEKVENKILSQNIYNKLFIRSNLSSNKNIKIIDGYNGFFLLKTFRNHLNLENGNSCLLNVFLLKHKFNCYFNFEHLVSCSLTKTLDFLERKRFFFNVKSHAPVLLLFLHPVKGGYMCFSSGVKAFLPLSHLKYVLIRKFNFKFIFDSLKSCFLYKLNFLCVNKKFNFVKNSFLFKLSGRISKQFTLSFLKRDRLFRQAKINNLKPKKRKLILKYSNFVFLTRPAKRNVYKKKLVSLSNKPTF